MGTVAQCVALLPHSKKVVGSSPASCNMSGVVPGPFCVEFACSPRVHPGSPRRTPTIKTCKKSRCSLVLTLTKSGPSTWTWSPGAASLAAHCSWMSLGEDSRMGKSREHLPPSSHLHVHVCVCVCRVCGNKEGMSSRFSFHFITHFYLSAQISTLVVPTCMSSDLQAAQSLFRPRVGLLGSGCVTPNKLC